MRRAILMTLLFVALVSVLRAIQVPPADCIGFVTESAGGTQVLDCTQPCEELCWTVLVTTIWGPGAACACTTETDPGPCCQMALVFGGPPRAIGRCATPMCPYPPSVCGLIAAPSEEGTVYVPWCLPQQG